MPDMPIDFVASPPPNLLSSDDVWRLIRECEDPATLDQWQAFGTLLLTELQERTASLDSKATNILGWSGAAAAASLATQPQTWWAAPVVTLSMVALGAGFAALRVRGASVPSQQDWFHYMESCDPVRLRRVHLLSMRDWHEHDALMNRTKAACLMVGQWALAGAAVALSLQLLLTR
jgi:hypothetical protein